MVAKLLFLFTRELLCDCYGIVVGCQGVALQLLGCSKWLSSQFKFGC